MGLEDHRTVKQNTNNSALRASCEPWQVYWKGKISVSCADTQNGIGRECQNIFV